MLYIVLLTTDRIFISFLAAVWSLHVILAEQSSAHKNHCSAMFELNIWGKLIHVFTVTDTTNI